MSINDAEAEIDEIELENKSANLWGPITRSDSMIRLNASPFWTGLQRRHKPGFKWGEECSDCDSDDGMTHPISVNYCRCCLINLIIAPFALGFLSYYTFANPDSTECWVNSEDDIAYPSPQGLPDEQNIAELWH